MTQHQQYIIKESYDKVDFIVFMIFSILTFIFVLFAWIFWSISNSNFQVRLYLISIPVSLIIFLIFLLLHWIIKKPILIVTKTTLQNGKLKIIKIDEIEKIELDDTNVYQMRLKMKNGNAEIIPLPNGLISLKKICTITQNELFLKSKYR